MTRAIALGLLATLPISLPALAASTVVLDYRDAKFRDGDPTISAKARERLGKALAAAPAPVREALKGGFAILGETKGPISGTIEETAYLLSPKRPVAAQPTGDQRQVVAVVKGDTLGGAYLLPPGAGYGRIIGTVAREQEAGRDVLLEGSFMNMGQLVTSLDVVRLGPGEAISVVRTLKEVYFDTCDNPGGAREKRAATLTIAADGKLSATWHELGCK